MAKAKKSGAEIDRKDVNAVVDEIKSKFGDGMIMKLGDVQNVDIDAIPTGAVSLDLALGIGGMPRGRVVEVYGPESSGKTTLALHVIANSQKMGGIAAFVDAEHALDPQYAKKIGVNIDDLLISQPDSGEQALDIVETLVKSGAIDIIVIDSVAALVPRAEIEGEMGDHHVGRQARLMSQALRKLTPLVARSNTTVIFINQIRIKIGVMFGNPETTTGGQALKFYSSVRVEVRRSAQIKKDDVVVGNRVKAKIVKNKIAPPFRTAEFDIMYNEGISITGDALDMGVRFDVIKKAGNSYSYGDEKMGVGREKVRAFLNENPKILATIKEDIVKAVEETEKEEA